MAIRDIHNEFANGLSEGPFLIIGLGNMGDEYDKTRHNAGFMALDAFISKIEAGSWKKRPEFSADIIETNVSGEKVIFAKPQTFMNNSGLAVVKLQNYFAVNDPRILVVYDDVDIDFMTVRTRIGGSNGGHNGIKSIENVIGDMFARIRIGVKNEHLQRQDTADFVLTKFSRAELLQMPAILDVANDFIEAFIARSFEETSKTITE
jgi:PTH1 family peptidyl-tRNA hydrolase